MMQGLIWAGAGMALAGVALLVFSGVLAMRVRRNADADPEAARAALSRVLFWNLGALALGLLGLIALVVGLILA
jgi:hypothetical protein